MGGKKWFVDVVEESRSFLKVVKMQNGLVKLLKGDFGKAKDEKY